mgnify:CR=1 FL=1
MNEFKLIVAGGRDFNDYETLSHVLFELSENEYANEAISIVSGMAKGADALGFKFAKENNIQLYQFPADWKRYPRSAGYMRNADMGLFADGLLAFWDGKSKGTAHMIRFMQAANKPVHIIRY